MARSTGRDDDPDAPLRRLGGGRWQTRDGRFTIEPQSGTWAVVDEAQTDELGLPLVRGPFGSLGAAKAAIAEARTSEAPASPLASRAASPPAPAGKKVDTATPARGRKGGDEPEAPGAPAAPSPPKRAARSITVPAAEAEPEPRWLRDLEPDERRRARRLIERLTAAGAADPEGLVRRDLVGDVPAVAAWAVRRALTALDDPAPAGVASVLVEGRDRELDVRWHLVDGAGRRIQLDLDDLEEAGDASR